jgi:hypothetical protein
MKFPSNKTRNLTSEEIQVKIKRNLTLCHNQDVIVCRLERSRLDEGDVATGGDVRDGLGLIVAPYARLVKR